MQSNTTRKDFILEAGALGGIALLSACSQQPTSETEPETEIAPEPEPEPTPEPAAHEAVVEAATGTYQGFLDDGIEAYLGIRFADPIEPFKAPQPPSTTTADIIEAKEFAPACLQPEDPTMEPSLRPMSSDCLMLNIWTKDHSATGKPVMVFFHGGSYVSGGTNDATMLGDNFVRNLPEGEDVVMVTATHRLGMLGQVDMSLLEGYTEEYADCNSLWALDAIQCLRWINENISAFGGDPKNVTVFGQSSGGMLAYHLCTVPEARKYFNRIIDESGSPFYGLQDKAAYQANCQAAFDELGVKTVEDLVNLTDDQIMEKIVFIDYVSASMSPRYIDGRVVPEDWWEQFEAGCAKDISIMIGFTNGEVDFSCVDGENYPNLLPAEAILDKLVAHYEPMGSPKYALNPLADKSILDKMMALGTDDPDVQAARVMGTFCIEIGAKAICDAQSKYGDVYQYSFNWQPDAAAITEGLEDATFAPTGRAPHCSELPIVFDTVEDGYTYLAKWWLGSRAEFVTEKYDTSKVPTDLVKQMQATWYAFAKTGNPNNDLIPTWSSYKPETRDTMAIDENWELVQNANQELFDVVEELVPVR